MSQRVEATYVLVDRMSRNADKIQKKLDKLEKSLHRIDKLTTDIGKNKGFDNFVRRTSTGADRVNKRLETMDKRMKAVNRSIDGTNKRVDRFGNSLDRANKLLTEHNVELGKAASRHKQAASDVAVHAKQQRDLKSAMAPTNRHIQTQTRLMDSHARTSMAMQHGLDKVIQKENKLGDAMARKNIHARNQIKHLRDIDKAADRTARSQRKLNREMSFGEKFAKRWRGIQNNADNEMFGFFGGMDMGASQYTMMKKLTALLPIIATGIGGIGSMAAGATGGVLGLVGSLGKLSGALAVLPGLYGAVGVAAGSFAGIKNTIFKPIMESKDALAGLDKQIADAQRALSQAKTRNAAATTAAGSNSSIAAMENAEANLNELMKERAEITKTIPKNAQKLLDAVDSIKDSWRAAWFGKNGDRATQVIDSAVKALSLGEKMIERFDRFFQKGVNLFSNVVDSADRLAKNPIFMGAMEGTLSNSFDNANRLLGIFENLAPVAAVIARNATIVTGEVLDGVMGWSKTYTEADKIADAQKRTLRWMRAGVAEAKKWGAGLKDLLDAFVILSGPAADEFDKRFFGKKGIFARFEVWAKKMDDSGALGKFSTNSWKVLDAMGGVLLSIAKVIGRIGSDKAATKGTVDFLNQLGRGVEGLGGFALKAMKEVGPEITKFFSAFSSAHAGSGDVIIEFIDKILIAARKVTEFADKFTPGETLGFISGMVATFTAIGGLFGTIALITSPATKAIEAVGEMTEAFRRSKDFLKYVGGGGGGTPDGGDKPRTPDGGGRWGKYLGALGLGVDVKRDWSASEVSVTNTVLNPVPVIIVGGMPGLGNLKNLGGGLRNLGKAWKPALAGATGFAGAFGLDKLFGGSKADEPAKVKAGNPEHRNRATININPGLTAAQLNPGMVTAKQLAPGAVSSKDLASGKIGRVRPYVSPEQAEFNKWYETNLKQRYPYAYGGSVGRHLAAQAQSTTITPEMLAQTEAAKRSLAQNGLPGGSETGRLQSMTKLGVGFITAGIALPAAPAAGGVISTAARGAGTKLGPATAGAGGSALAMPAGAFAKNTKKEIDDATKAGEKSLVVQGKKLGTKSSAAGKAAYTPLFGWAQRVNEIMASMGVPSSITSGYNAATGTRTGAAAQYGTHQPTPPKTGDSNKPAAQGGGNTAGLSAAMGPAISLANKMGGVITSGFRPGAITSSGNKSDHSTGNAIDVGGSPALMSKIALAANALPGVKQVIYSPLGWARDGAPFSPVTDAAVKANHYDHVHIAMGGNGKGGGAGAMGLPNLPGFPNTMMGQATGAMAQKAYDYLSAQLGSGGDPSAMGAGGGSMEQIIQSAASAYGASYPGLLAVARAESSLNPNAANNWDINAKNGTPSKGLFQFIEPTFNSMSAQAMAANPGAWSGINKSWMDPTSQALTAAWAFTHGQGSHWATASHYQTGDGIGDSNGSGSAVGGSRRPVAKTPTLRGTRRSTPTTGGGGRGGNVIQTTVVVQGALFLDESGREKLGDMVGEHVARHVIRATPNASANKDI